MLKITSACGCYLEPSIYYDDYGTAAFFLDNEFDTIGNASATDSSTGDVYYFNPCSNVSCNGTDATITGKNFPIYNGPFTMV